MICFGKQKGHRKPAQRSNASFQRQWGIRYEREGVRRGGENEMGSFSGKNSRSMFHGPNGANATAAEQSDTTDPQKK